MMDESSEGGSWEQRKKAQRLGQAYFLPSWYVLYGLWVWPLLVTLVLVLVLAHGDFKSGFAVAWVAFMIALGVYVGILGRRWPIRRRRSEGSVGGDSGARAG